MKSRQYAGFYVYEFLQILRTDKFRRLMRRPYREVIMRNGLTHWINKKIHAGYVYGREKTYC